MKSLNEMGDALKKALDECGIKSITPVDDKMFIGYDENGKFCVIDCHFKNKDGGGVFWTKIGNKESENMYSFKRDLLEYVDKNGKPQCLKLDGQLIIDVVDNKDGTLRIETDKSFYNLYDYTNPSFTHLELRMNKETSQVISALNMYNKVLGVLDMRETHLNETEYHLKKGLIADAEPGLAEEMAIRIKELSCVRRMITKAVYEDLNGEEMPDEEP